MSGQARDDITIAIQEDYDPDNPEPLRLEAADLDPLSGTLEGGSIEATVSSNWVAVCGTGEQPHVGRWRVFARCTCAASDTQVRLSYRSGDGPFASLPPALPHLTDEGIELDLGLASITEAEGDHAWSGQVEVRGPTLADFEITDLLFMPATHYARVRSPLRLETPTALEARDEFAQVAGALTGKTLPQGGTWQGAGDADDFAVTGSPDNLAQRTSGSDAGANPEQGRICTASTPTLAAVGASVDVRMPALSDIGTSRLGLVLRWVDIDNFIAVWATIPTTGSSVWVYKRVAGTTTPISNVPGGLVPGADTWYRVMATIDPNGVWAAWFGLPGNEQLVAVGQDAVLATGGALDDGEVGIIDNHTVTSATREYDNFAAWIPEVDHAIHPDESLRFTHEKAEHENADGTRWGRVPHFEGARLKVPPSTRNSHVHRLVVKQDRNDLTQLPVGDPSAVNRCTNPSAETDTTGWASAAANTFERDTSLPTLDGLPAGITTGFHLVTDGDAEGAFDDVAVENGKTYSFSAYVYLDTNTAPGVALQIRNATGTVKATGATFSTLDDWTRINVSVTADATGTWQFRARQQSAGGADWYFTAVSIAEVDQLSATLTVTPRVLLTSG